MPVETLWETVAVQYGDIANSHPSVWRSEYLGDSTTGELGAERRLDFNRRGTKALHERIVAWDTINHTMSVQLFQADGFPIAEEDTLARLSFTEAPDGGSTFTFDFTYQTTPAFLGGVMQGSFEGLLEDYFIALDHYLQTGEQINATTGNFKGIKRSAGR